MSDVISTSIEDLLMKICFKEDIDGPRWPSTRKSSIRQRNYQSIDNGIIRAYTTIIEFDVVSTPSNRAAVVARALARVGRKPSLVWMVLSQNNDVVCSYLDEALEDSVSVPSRKRCRSPFDDDQGAHRTQSK
jgi:hypothetical protein